MTGAPNFRLPFENGVLRPMKMGTMARRGAMMRHPILRHWSQILSVLAGSSASTHSGRAIVVTVRVRHGALRNR